MKMGGFVLSFLSIDVLISTFGERIKSLEKVLKEPRHGVKYLIGHQASFDCGPPPEFLNRSDVTYYDLDTLGVTKSRNWLLDKGTSDIFYFCDDDIILAANFDEILRNAHSKDNSEVITLRVNDEDGNSRKKILSTKECNRNWFSILSVGTIEISVKNNPTNNIRFCPYMGAGTKIPIGDEAVFLAEYLRVNKRISFHNVVIASHPLESSGASPTIDCIYARGVTLRKVYGFWWGCIMCPIFLIVRSRLIITDAPFIGVKAFISGFLLRKLETLI